MADEMMEHWTFETLRKYLEARIEDKDRLYQVQFASAEKLTGQALVASREAVSVANTANEKRFDSTNEWRATYGDMTKNFVTHSEMRSLSDKIDDVRSRFENFQSTYLGGEGRSGAVLAQRNWGVQLFVASAIGIVAVVLSVVALLTRPAAVTPVVQMVPAPTVPMQNAPVTVPRQ